MNNFPPNEELIDKLCIVCKGTKVHDDEVCFHCGGKGMTKWPKRCKGDCAKCKEREVPIDPIFKVGERVMMDAPGLAGNGTIAVITEIDYMPCFGNDYRAGILNDNDHNIRLSGKSILKRIGSEKKITDFFGGENNG